MTAGDALEDIDKATSVRVQNGERVVTDGPFAETKETLGGYYLLDVANLDEAIEAAERCPGARTGTIELRPVAELPPEMPPRVSPSARTRSSTASSGGSRAGRSRP